MLTWQFPKGNSRSYTLGINCLMSTHTLMDYQIKWHVTCPPKLMIVYLAKPQSSFWRSKIPDKNALLDAWGEITSILISSLEVWLDSSPELKKLKDLSTLDLAQWGTTQIWTITLIKQPSSKSQWMEFRSTPNSLLALRTFQSTLRLQQLKRNVTSHWRSFHRIVMTQPMFYLAAMPSPRRIAQMHLPLTSRISTCKPVTCRHLPLTRLTQSIRHAQPTRPNTTLTPALWARLNWLRSIKRLRLARLSSAVTKNSPQLKLHNSEMKRQLSNLSLTCTSHLLPRLSRQSLLRSFN